MAEVNQLLVFFLAMMQAGEEANQLDTPWIDDEKLIVKNLEQKCGRERA